MSLSFNQQLRILKEREPLLYEAISKIYKSTLFEEDNSNVSSTKGVTSLMDTIHGMVGINPDKKIGDDIFNEDKEPDVPDVQAIPSQDPLGYGIESTDEDYGFDDLFSTDESSTDDEKQSEDESLDEENQSEEAQENASSDEDAEKEDEDESAEDEELAKE